MSATTPLWERDVPIHRLRLFSAPFIFWSVLAAVGISLSLARLFTGLWFTGMNDDYAWGVWKTFNVMTLTALGSAGFAVGLFTYVFGQKQLHPVMRAAIASSILFYGTGMTALAIDVGRPWNMYHLLLPWNWNTHSALFEVALCMTLYVSIFLVFETLPLVLEQVAINAKTRTRQRIDALLKFMVRLYPFFIAGALLLPAMHQSSLGSLMVIAGAKVHPLWQTQMLPAFYLIQAVVCGFAALIFILMSASLSWQRALDIPILGDLSKFMAWTGIAFVVLRYVDGAIRGVLEHAYQPTWYAALFHLETLLIAGPAVLLLRPGMRRIPRVLFVAAILMGAGGVIYRFTPTTIAYRAGHPSLYFPKIAEVLMCLGYIGLAVVLFIWAAKRFAILPGTTADWYAYVKYVKRTNPEARMDEHGAATHD
jgi:Ni/Fe-hydrogenase subunit HybB-like protein